MSKPSIISDIMTPEMILLVGKHSKNIEDFREKLVEMDDFITNDLIPEIERKVASHRIMNIFRDRRIE